MSERTAIDAVAEAWASIDGNLQKYEYEKANEDAIETSLWGHYEGYQAEAVEMIHRIEARGYKLVRLDA